MPDPTATAGAGSHNTDGLMTEEVTIELERRAITVPYSAGDTLLQTARMAGLAAPSSCETGSCATCMARRQPSASGALFKDPSQVKVNWQPVGRVEPSYTTLQMLAGNAG